MLRVAVLISGRGSNLEALLKAALPATFVGVISNRPGVGGLALAAAQGVPTRVIDHKAFASREAFDDALADALAALNPDLIVQAGFMRILGSRFVQRFAGRMINIHPSLLPAFPGLDTHGQALRAGVKLHGCSVHLVTEALDAGPIIAQAVVPVLAGDDESALAARVLIQEHRLLPAVVRGVAEGSVKLLPGSVVISPTLAVEPAWTTSALVSPPLR
ncbi:MAG: phosphoribosylglycinamide formyltransferase [Betaproteobacteria bacterium]|nr:phosphoribosylglycinamide formyltransferase [Betaproteobacteria bacterium]